MVKRTFTKIWWEPSPELNRSLAARLAIPAGRPDEEYPRVEVIQCILQSHKLFPMGEFRIEISISPRTTGAVRITDVLEGLGLYRLDQVAPLAFWNYITHGRGENYTDTAIAFSRRVLTALGLGRYWPKMARSDQVLDGALWLDLGEYKWKRAGETEKRKR